MNPMKEQGPVLTLEAQRRCEEVAEFIERYSAVHGGNSPTLNEIGQALHMSKTAVHSHLSQLIAEGRAVREDRKLWLIAAEK